MIHPLSNKTGKKVDWWFMYKLPKSIGPDNNSSGFEFLYYDSESKEKLHMSDVQLDHDQSALGLTLRQVFDKNAGSGYVLWNDEIPPTKRIPDPKNHGSKGHSKGILGFDKKSGTGFYLLHSTPRFPNNGMLDLPDNEKIYGQTYLCIGLNSYDTVNQIAEILHTQNEVQVYYSKLTNVSKDEWIYKLANDLPCDRNTEPAHLKLKTENGYKFEFIAKSKYWSEPGKGEKTGKDFWKDLVGPSLKCNLDVETWRRGLVFGDMDEDVKKTTQDVIDIDLSGIGIKDYSWTFTKDHSKWGISIKENPGYIIIADINRQNSQARGGGGGLAFRCNGLWQSLKDIQIAEKGFEKIVHKDSKDSA
ncbi:MAG: deoxyribonuclease II family protein [Bacteroidia bacterium]|nr:deoxyribonuclease II family protein [Bacteroidia bacterium]